MDFHRWLRRQKQLNANAATTINEAGFPIAGDGEQTIRLLVSDELDLSALPNPPVALTIPANVLIVKLFALRTDDATTGDPPNRITLRIGPSSNLNALNDVIIYDLTNAYAGIVHDVGDEYILLEDGGDTFSADPALLLDAFARGAFSNVETKVQITKQNITAGHIKVYALIAEPAS